MGYSVTTSITPHAAAKLLLSNEIDITYNIQQDIVEKIFEELLSLTIDECLSIVDSNNYGNIADIKHIPQFGKIETLIRVPQYFVDKGQSSVDYPQLGFYLKPDINASLVANSKFGENHGKATSLLGLTACVNGRIIPSALTTEFCSCDYDKQSEILLKLLFRIPIVQITLKGALHGVFDGYVPMNNLMESTRKRRSQSMRTIFKALSAYPHIELKKRLDNIIWKED